MSDLAVRLAERTLALVDLPSESRHEHEVLRAIHDNLPAGLEVLDDLDATLFAAPRARRAGLPLVVFAGHVDTVPPVRNVPGRIERGRVVGRGASDMKGGVAVMLEIAHDLAADPGAAELDVAFCWFGREELPFDESALRPLLARCSAATAADLAIVMEPTANHIEVGCLGNLNATITVVGTAAHSARPWLGDNAIHRAIAALAPLAELPVREVTVDGLTFREVVNVTTIDGGVAANVIPDRVRARVNMRYAPGTAPGAAERRLRELLAPAGVEVAVDGNAPPAPVSVTAPLVMRLRAAANAQVRPKQAWTPVAEFAAAGVDAVNFGPGDPQYAHRDDELVEVDALVRCHAALRRFLGLDGPVDEEVPTR